MRNIGWFLALLIFAPGCSDDDNSARLKPGEFMVRLYDADGNLLFTKNGEVMVVGSEYVDGWEIRLLDPTFATQDAHLGKTFASLTMFGLQSIESAHYVTFNDNNRAALHEHWYPGEKSWSYESISGKLIFTQISDTSINGFFEITLNADETGNQNSFWGNKVIAKGSFSGVPFDPNF